jgi:hypothetical protein
MTTPTVTFEISSAGDRPNAYERAWGTTTFDDHAAFGNAWAWAVPRVDVNTSNATRVNLPFITLALQIGQ